MNSTESNSETFRIPVFFTYIWASNYPPINDDAMWERIKIIPFNP